MDNATAQTSYDGGPPGRAPTKGSVNASVDDPLLVVEDGSVAASGATILQTTISVIKVCIGAGVLALPYAFSQGGLVVGSIGLSGIALWNYWTTMMLLRTKDELSLQKYVPPAHVNSSFGALAHRALGNWGLRIVDYSLIFTLMGVCATYQIQIGQLTASMGWTANDTATQRYFILGSVVFVLPLALLRDLSRLSYAGAVALGALAAGFVAIFVYGAQANGIPEHLPHSLVALPSFRHFSVLFGIIVFAFGIPTIILPIQEGMREPRRVREPLRRGMVCVLVLYLVLAVLGALLFISDPTKPIQQIIILNLPTHALVARIVKMLNAVVAIFSFPLPFMPVAQMLEPQALQSGGLVSTPDNTVAKPRLSAARRRALLWRCAAIRTGMVVGTTLVALFVPCFGLVCAFIGCFTVSLLSFILPPLFMIRICGPKLSLTELVLSRACIAFGVVVMLFTSVLTGIQLVETLQQQV